MNEPYHSPEYTQYMRSDRWQVYRLRELARAGYRCEYRPVWWLPFWRCPVRKTRGKPVVLQVNHKDYRNLGHERRGDTNVLCLKHHAWADYDRQRHPDAWFRFWRWLRDK